MDMSRTLLPFLALVALALPNRVQAQVFEITRELGTPEHHYLNNPPFFTSATEAVASSGTSQRHVLHLGQHDDSPATHGTGRQEVRHDASVNFSWPGDLNLIPTGSSNSGTLQRLPGHRDVSRP
jgi:hypothetical protein